MLTKEEIQMLMERETINEFFHVIDAEYYEASKCTIYELETGYFGIMMRIFPPSYPGPHTEQTIASAISCGMPKGTIVQMHTITSRNLAPHINNYERNIVDDITSIRLEHPEVLEALHQANIEFTEKHIEHTVFEKEKLSFYLRDYINTVTLLIPMRDEAENMRLPEDIIPFINKFKGAMYKLFPVDVPVNQHIRIVREMICPYNPIHNITKDPGVDIRDHYSDSTSIIHDEGQGVLRLCDSRAFPVESQMRAEKKKVGMVTKLLRKFGASPTKVQRTKELEPIRDDTYFAKVITRKSFPEYTNIFRLTDLNMDFLNTNVQQQIPLPHTTCLTIVVDDPIKSKNDTNMKAMWNKQQTEKLGKLGEYFPELQERSIESDRVIQVLNNGEIPFKVSWSMVMYSKDKDMLEYYSEMARTKYQEEQFMIQQEDLIALQSFMYMIPMKYDEIWQDFSKRFQTVFKSNVGAIAPVGNDSRGFGQDAIMQLFGRNGQPQILDLYDPNATNKNVSLVGPSGTGKSFFMSRLVWSYLKGGSKIRIIDSGYSYKPLCDLLGGQYIDFPDDNDICMNPFTHALTDGTGMISEDEIANITTLIGIMAGYDLTENEDNASSEITSALTAYISDAVIQAWESQGKEAGLKDVVQAMRNRIKNQKEAAAIENSVRDGDIDKRLQSLILSLRNFSEPAGPYYSYVNGPANISFKSDLVILEMDNLSAKEKRFQDFVLTAMTNQIQREFYVERNNRQRKILLIDEAWSLLSGKAGIVVLGLYKRARKMQGSIITITQSINDYYINENIKGIYSNSYWRIFLEQDPSEIQNAKDEKRIVIDEFAFRLLETVETRKGQYSEAMIMTKTGDLMISRILSTKVELWLSTQDEKELNRIAAVAKEFRIDEITARSAIGFSEQRGTEIEDEILRIRGFEDQADEELMTAEVN